MSFADTYCCPNIGVNSSLYTLPSLPFFLFSFLVARRFVVFGDQKWGDLGGLHSNKSRPELTVSRLTARNAIRVATRIVMFLVWPRPELSCVVTRNETLSGYRYYMDSIRNFQTSGESPQWWGNLAMIKDHFALNVSCKGLRSPWSTRSMSTRGVGFNPTPLVLQVILELFP